MNASFMSLVPKPQTSFRSKTFEDALNPSYEEINEFIILKARVQLLSRWDPM